MQARALAWLGLCVLASACSSRNAIQDDEATSEQGETIDGVETGESETIDGGETEESGTTGVVGEPCACVESLELICDDQYRPTALHDCWVPNPCGRVHLDEPNADMATCVLQQLVDQDQPSRFDYIAHVPGGWGDDTYVGTFYVLGPGTGLDLECVHYSYDCCAPPPGVATPAFHTLEDPAYFQDCIGESASVMTGCIFNGLELIDIVPECAGP
jgi:hypothetical protein